MEREFNKRLVHGLFLLPLLFMTSCIDDSYDLTKDIDMTVTVGGNLVSPIISTESITLNDFIELNSESNIKTKSNGDYYLGLEGVSSDADITISSVSIDKTSTEVSSSYLTFDKNLITNGEVTEEVQDLNPEFNITNNDVPADVVDIKEALIKSDAVAIHLSFPSTTNINGVWLKKGFEIKFPEYLMLNKYSPDLEYTLTNNTMILSDDIYIPRSGKTYYISCNGIDFTKAPSGEGFITNGNQRSIHFNVKLSTKGQAYMKSTDFPTDENIIKFQILCDMQVPQMDLAQVTAKVNPDINVNIDPVHINDIPDFLSDDRVRLDLENPQIMLNLTNNSPVTVSINAKIKAYKNNQLTKEIGVGSDYGTSPIYARNGQNNICLSTLGTHDAEISDVNDIKVEGLSDILSIIPDRIEITDVKTVALPEYYTIELGSSYTFNTNYNVNAPLKFGPDLNIVYSDSITNLDSDLKDIEFQEIHAEIDATNNIPLQLALNAKPYDKYGHEMQDVDVTVNGNITAGTLEAGQDSHMEIIIKGKTKNIKGLDKIILQLTGTLPDSNKNETLNKNQTIKFNSIRLKVINGVTIDLN